MKRKSKAVHAIREELPRLEEAPGYAAPSAPSELVF
jgi:hypothetical protein